MALSIAHAASLRVLKTASEFIISISTGMRLQSMTAYGEDVRGREGGREGGEREEEEGGKEKGRDGRWK